MKKNILVILPLILIVWTCKEKNYSDPFTDPFVFSKTVKELNNVVLQNNFPPIVASRNYTYASIAAYEVIVMGDNHFQSLAGQIKHLPALPRQNIADVNFHYASLIAFCKVGEAVTFPEGSMKVYMNRLDSIAEVSGMSSEMMKASKQLAAAVIDHILNWSKKDNYAQTRTAEKYKITQEEGRWVPTPPAYTQALEPNWKLIRPMVMDSASQFMPPRPPLFNMTDKESKFYKEVAMVKNAVDSLTEEQKHIAMFWDDLGSKTIVQGHVMFTAKKFTPTGHWMNIVGIAAQKDNADFSETVYAYAKTSIAMFDAFISVLG